jgi:hypothetical protein
MLTSSMEYPQILSRQGLDKDFIPRQLQRMYLDASENG